jgi:exopolysaccharide production protein ExoQ
MSPNIATLVCACGIAWLLYLDREKTPRVSKALWIPGLWIGVVASRSVTQWLGLEPPSDVQLSGSPVDAAFYGVLLAIAVVVLIRRKAKTRTLLLANWAILIYFLYCLISVAWSYHPDVSVKRWTKAIGDLAIVLVIATDEDPVAALRRVVSRVGFLLLPISVLFIKYYGYLGRGYTSEGWLMNTGVTTNKNSLGLTVMLISLVVLWNVRSLLIHKEQPDRGRRLVAQGVLLAFGLLLLWMANSSTSKACFILGGFVMIASGLPAIRRQPARVHALCFAIIAVAGIAVLLGGEGGVISALGRQSTMSGRTEIWPAVIQAVPNPILGAGFEGFWISPSVEVFRQQLLDWGWYPPLVAILNEAHNGYIETYLNLGMVGVCLIAMIFIAGYRSSVKAFRRNPELGSLMLAFIAVAAVYSITEAGFRMLSPAWIFLLLIMVSAAGVRKGLFKVGGIDPVPVRKFGPRRTAAIGRNRKPAVGAAREYSKRALTPFGPRR